MKPYPINCANIKVRYTIKFYVTDIDECRRPGACGVNTLCHNNPGNYTCACQAGYTGNPFDGVSIKQFKKLGYLNKNEYFCTIKVVTHNNN